MTPPSVAGARPAPAARARPETHADRRGYLEGGLRELACDSCGVTVRAKKSSAQQTSIQWSAAAVRGCTEFADRTARGEPTALIATCTRLRDSIGQAVRDGRLDARQEPP